MVTANNREALTSQSSQQVVQAHEDRVKQELRAAGVTRFGSIKFAAKYLYRVIHPDEHVKGVVYGRYGEGGILSLSEGMLIATDRRVIFLDYKPGYTNLEEITYEVVSGIKRFSAGFFSGITLHTRIGDYSLRFVNDTCANTFAGYIEGRRLESSGFAISPESQLQTARTDLAVAPTASIAGVLDEDALNFLRTHDTGVLSTLGANDEIHGSTVHYAMGASGQLFILTKAGTAKAHAIFAHRQVAFTVYDALAVQTVQLQGVAQIEAGQSVKDWAWRMLTRPRLYGDAMQLPPVTDLHEGAFMLIRLTPTYVRFSDYKTTKQ
jgi:Pyridoxamine 5'-phosphate oxidase/Bacterial PH domain